MYHDYLTEARRLQQRGVRVEVVRSYSELVRIRDAFVTGHRGYAIPFLVVIGPPGLSKSRMFEAAQDAYYTVAAVSAVGLYSLAYRHQNLPIIVDDVDGLMRDPAAVSVLKAIANDRPSKLVAWEKQNTILQAEGIPLRFATSSRLCILANDLPRANRNVAAVYDRAKLVYFLPTAQEVHDYVTTWWDPRHSDILEFLGGHVDRITCPSIRWYTDGLREKRLGVDWRSWILIQMEDRDRLLSLAAAIQRESPPGEARVAEWKRRTGLSRSWFYRYQREYLLTQGGAGSQNQWTDGLGAEGEAGALAMS